MRILAVYSTITGNTLKLLKGIKKSIREMRIIKSSKKAVKEIKKAELVIFASGIYMWKHHKKLLRFSEDIPKIRKKALIMSTAGLPFKWIMHLTLRKILEKKGFIILGEFSCKGYDKFGPLKIFGGINKGHPNKKDINMATEFIKNKIK
ncbi:MAG: flavodoxin domain-containing protein [Candidatus Pacearchaeota archaeon]